MPGQITLDTPFGAALKDLAADPAYKIYIESGTFDGEGSTKCLVEGLEARSPEDLSGAGLFSFEANKQLWMVASRYWQDKNPPLRILWGRLGEQMMGKEKVEAHPLFEKIKEHYDLYYEKDVEWFLKAPLIRMRRCDVWLCDGGEFSTEGEWDAIRVLKPKVVALDDIHVVKCNDLYNLLVGAGWKQLFVTSTRNGAAILESPGDVDCYYPQLPVWRPAAEPDTAADTAGYTQASAHDSLHTTAAPAQPSAHDSLHTTAGDAQPPSHDSLRDTAASAQP